MSDEVKKEVETVNALRKQTMTPVVPAPPEDSNFIKCAKRYASIMPPNAKIKSVQAGLEQMVLWTAIRTMFREVQSQTACHAEWNVFLGIVQANRETCFSENWVLCFPANWTLGTNEYKTFRAALHLAMKTCNPVTRSTEIKSISMNTLMQSGFTANEQNKIVAFYS